MYDPTVGRWTTRDPLEFDAGQANLYEYVANSPTNGTDPSGLDFRLFGKAYSWPWEKQAAFRLEGSLAGDLLYSGGVTSAAMMQDARRGVGEAREALSLSNQANPGTDMLFGLVDGGLAIVEQGSVTAARVASGAYEAAGAGAAAYSAGALEGSSLVNGGVSAERLVVNMAAAHTDLGMLSQEELDRFLQASPGVLRWTKLQKGLHQFGETLDPASRERGEASAPTLELIAQAVAAAATDGASLLTQLKAGSSAAAEEVAAATARAEARGLGNAAAQGDASLNSLGYIDGYVKGNLSAEKLQAVRQVSKGHPSMQRPGFKEGLQFIDTGASDTKYVKELHGILLESPESAVPRGTLAEELQHAIDVGTGYHSPQRIAALSKKFGENFNTIWHQGVFSRIAEALESRWCPVTVARRAG